MSKANKNNLTTDNIFILQDPYHILGFELAALAHFYLLDWIARKVFK